VGINALLRKKLTKTRIHRKKMIRPEKMKIKKLLTKIKKKLKKIKKLTKIRKTKKRIKIKIKEVLVLFPLNMIVSAANSGVVKLYK
jgi:hypothetical protein